jgi:hypothetical protein
MVSRLSKLCVAAIALVGVLVLSPAAALADSCQGGSGASNIYSECIPTPSGGTHHSGGGQKTTTPAPTPAPVYPVQPPVAPPVTVSPKVQKTIKHAHHHKKFLKKLVTDPSLGATQSVHVPASYRATPPSALGAVFDLGSGPTALFAMLATIAIVLLGVGGLRGRKQR